MYKKIKKNDDKIFWMLTVNTLYYDKNYTNYTSALPSERWAHGYCFKKKLIF